MVVTDVFYFCISKDMVDSLDASHEIQLALAQLYLTKGSYLPIMLSISMSVVEIP